MYCNIFIYITANKQHEQTIQNNFLSVTPGWISMLEYSLTRSHLTPSFHTLLIYIFLYVAKIKIEMINALLKGTLDTTFSF